MNGREYNTYELLEKDIFKFSMKGSVLLLGDFNSRVSTMSDFIKMMTINTPRYPIHISVTNMSSYW